MTACRYRPSIPPVVGPRETIGEIIERQDGAAVEAEDDDEDARTVFIDTSRPITVERVECGRDRAWLDFQAGDQVGERVMIGVDILGGRPGVELVILGNQIGPSFIDQPQLTLDDVRQIRDDLTALLADDRLLGALAEQTDDRDDGERESDEAQYDDPPAVPWRTPAEQAAYQAGAVYGARYAVRYSPMTLDDAEQAAREQAAYERGQHDAARQIIADAEAAEAVYLAELHKVRAERAAEEEATRRAA